MTSLPLWFRWFMAVTFVYCGGVVAAFFLLLCVALAHEVPW